MKCSAHNEQLLDIMLGEITTELAKKIVKQWKMQNLKTLISYNKDRVVERSFESIGSDYPSEFIDRCECSGTIGKAKQPLFSSLYLL